MTIGPSPGNAKHNPAFLGDGFIARGHAALDGCRAGHGIDHAGELDEGSIAHKLDDATVMLGDFGID